MKCILKKKILQKLRETIQFTYTDKDTASQAASLSVFSSMENIQKMRIAGAHCLLAYIHTQGSSAVKTKSSAFSQ